jgi:cyclic lactone autoinducer peptide
MKRRVGKLMTAFIATICTIMAISTSASACIWFYYQPEEPECLRK